MVWVNILVVAVLFFSFLGGLKGGAVKKLFALAALVIAIPFAGGNHHLIANILAFLPGSDWENFIGFFITLAVISVILHVAFLVPRKLIGKVWPKGVLFRLFGGIFSVLSAGTGMAVFALVLGAYPIIGWLARAVMGSGCACLAGGPPGLSGGAAARYVPPGDQLIVVLDLTPCVPLSWQERGKKRKRG